MSGGGGTIDLQDLIVAPEMSVLEVLKTIDHNGMAMAMVCDAARTLVAVVTDGDIRRHLIRGGTVSEPISRAFNPKFISLTQDLPRQEALSRMVAMSINCLPVVDASGRLIDVHTRKTSLAAVSKNTESWAMVMAGGTGERHGELTTAIPSRCCRSVTVRSSRSSSGTSSASASAASSSR